MRLGAGTGGLDLTKDAVTDARLHRLFDRADKNKDGVVTKDELIVLAKEMDAKAGDEGGRGGPVVSETVFSGEVLKFRYHEGLLVFV